MDKKKNILIPYDVFFSVANIFNAIDKKTLPEDMRFTFETVHGELMEKRARERNRQAYAGILIAQNDTERAEALENYKRTKEIPVYV